MTNFRQSTTAEAVVPVARERIWALLTDPATVARLTPFVRSIEERDGYWIWSMSGLNVGGRGFSPVFTERMTLTELSRIEFTHEPPAGSSERAGVEGFYSLTPGGPDDPAGSTRLETRLEVCVDLPVPKVSGGAVRAAMKGVMGQMGDRFSKNILAELGVG